MEIGKYVYAGGLEMAVHCSFDCTRCIRFSFFPLYSGVTKGTIILNYLKGN